MDTWPLAELNDSSELNNRSRNGTMMGHELIGTNPSGLT